MESSRGYSGAGGILGSIQSLADGLFESARNRLALFSVELQEEKLHVIQLLVWTGIALFAGFMATVMISVTIVYLFWEEARIWALAGLSAFYLLILAIFAFKLSRHFKNQQKPFSGTIAQFNRDRECIHPET